MAAWDAVSAVQENKSAPSAPEIPDGPAEKKRTAAACPAEELSAEAAEPEQLNFDPTAGQPEPLHYVGEVFKTYILAERGDELCLIDKHAAHERQLYEKLAASYGNVPGQLLLEPADVEPQNAESLLVEIANKLLKGGHDALNEHTEWVLHSISCRAAIKAGDKSSPQELLALAEKILSGEVPPFCPHGRPCVLKLTRKELEKQFGRIV